ncbi:MAG: NDP-sugar synthase [Acidobacteria bacterium]|nr:NDP-sugar synthase [Acidobacteriota bacterium]
MKAMILAAGFGTRLWPLTIERTKPAIPFLNRPLIAYTIEYLKQYGITDIIINLHHEPESVRDQIGDGTEYGVKIHYSLEEPEILGTSGAIDKVRDLLQDETFLVVNGKIITNLDLSAALQTHRSKKAIATLVMKPNPKCEKFSEIIVDENGFYQGFGGFPKATDQGRLTSDIPLMFVGIHILEPKIFEYIPRAVFSDSIRDVYPNAMAAGEKIAAHVGEGDWYELSTLARYLEISLEFMRRESLSYTADQGCEIAHTAQVTESVLWQNVRVEAGARVHQCVLADGVHIPANTQFERKVIVRAALVINDEIPEKATRGEIIGENYVVAIN